MANGEFIEILSPSALTDLQALNTALADTVISVTKINQMMGTAGTPSGNLQAISDLNKAYQEQTAIVQNLQAQLTKLQTVKSSTNAKTSEEIVNQRILAQNADNVAKANSNLVGSYQKLALAYANQKKLALDLGATYGIQSKAFVDASAKANAMAQELANLNTQVKVNTTGSSAYGNAFTNALSAIYSKVRVLAYILPGIGVAGIFSLALGPLFDYIKGLDIVQKAMGIVSEQTKYLQSAMRDVAKEASTNAAAQQVSAKILLETAKDTTLSYETRIAAADKLHKQYGIYFDDLTTEQILAGQTTEAEKALNAALIERAKSEAALSKITENQSKLIDIDFQILDAKKQVTEAAKKQADSYNKLVTARNSTSDAEIFAARADAVALKNAKQKVIDLTNQQKALKALGLTLEQYAIAAGKASAGLDVPEKKAAKTKAEKRPDEEVLNTLKLANANQGLYDKLVANKKALEDTQKLVSKNNDDWKEWQVRIDAVQLAIDLLTGSSSALDKDMQNTAKNAIAQFKMLYGSTTKIKNGMKDLSAESKASMETFNKFVGDFMTKAGFGQSFDFIFKQQKNGITLFKTLTDSAATTQEKTTAVFEAVASASQDAFNLIEKSQISNFEAEKTRLSDQKDIALSFAGDSAAAKLKIEKEYQAELRAINRKEAIAKKETAMFNIAIDTAQAVMSVAGKGEEWMIPVMIALGALEEVLVASQKLPTYWTGTDNASKGWAWTDERGAEIHADKFGNIKDFGSNSGARLKYLDKGDQIFDAYATKKLLNQNDFDADLNHILTTRGINTPVIINNSITASQMDEILRKHLASQTKQHIQFDKNGFGSYISKNGNITRRSEDRGSGIGLKV